MAKRVAVIGSGVSGLTSIKCCLDEGLQPTCFERSDDIGGLWRFKEKVEEGRASIYQSVFTNSSKEMSCFSDFPMPEHFPNFLHNTRFLEYLKLYAKRFDLLNYIKFKTTVISVRKCQDFSTTGQWIVVTESDGKQESTVFDAVMVCMGHHIESFIPVQSFPGIEKFKGQYFHSREYKSPEGFQGKTVVVIGMGNSASDIAVELCQTAKRVFISTRGGSWVMSRVYDDGYPWDTVFHTRFSNLIRSILPWPLLKRVYEKKMNQWFNHENYGLVKGSKIKTLFNDDLPSRILCGSVVVKPIVKEFTETAAIFEDGTMEDNVDVVIFATGYSFSFPFLEQSVIKVENNEVSLYKQVFPPTLEKPTLAVIGLIQPLGPIMPNAELQARWATRVFKGTWTGMLCYMHNNCQHAKHVTRFILKWAQLICSGTCKILDITDQGRKPRILPLLLKDPILALTIYFGPCSPFQFRLTGPGKWDGARNAILTQKARIIKPTRTRVVRNSSNNSLISYLLKIFGLLALFAAIFVSLQ
uniref:Flavin-containing monooxygenase n=1 Tax=Chelonoidis abingdonii TaxID=106734 RepID=A0A8C0J1E2_CHEAB